MKKWRQWIWAGGFAFWLAALPLHAQDAENRQIAGWVQTLIPYLKWQKGVGRLTICTVGGGRVDEALKELAEKESAEAARRGKKLNPVYVERQTTQSQFKGCDMLYISASETDVVEDIIDKLQDRAVVTVSAIDNFALRGGIIEFMSQGGKLKLRINTRRANQVGVRIDADLLGIAETVQN